MCCCITFLIVSLSLPAFPPSGGGLVRSLAAAEPSWNFLGLDIRRLSIELCLARSSVSEDASASSSALETTEGCNGTGVVVCSQRQRKNLHYAFANANVHLAKIMEFYPGPVRIVSALFPDPHTFKSKHQKRRMVTPGLIDTIAYALAGGNISARATAAHPCIPGEGGAFLFKSDVPEVVAYVF